MLISIGLIDSFPLVSLKVFIEKEFGKKMLGSKITAGRFDTVEQVMKIISEF